MSIQPVKLHLIDPHTLAILWSDGQWQGYDVAELRRACPCAACISAAAGPGSGTDRPTYAPSENEPRENQSGGTGEEPVPPPLRILQMSPVGNYAYRVRFSDGHDTGIYTLEVLRGLGRAPPKDVEASLK